eukprot:TRINITY_DN570_c0_g2_i1.p1 TRINITY_DN570_c0_g2~~TRINITY_DN570_c0_g2_i1.p1  ORF type:complete len:505 (+),score=155.13 TRINITY_DN570_c0_g2_i1:230-1744(+)
MAFVTKTFEMINSPANNELVYWSANGESFCIQNIDVFEKTILPKHFKHSKFSSFVRQLNFYGFKKLHFNGSSKDIWEFKHPNFRKNHPELLRDIKRRTSYELSYVDIESMKTDIKLLNETVNRLNSTVATLHQTVSSLQSQMSIMQQQQQQQQQRGLIPNQQQQMFQQQQQQQHMNMQQPIPLPQMPGLGLPQQMTSNMNILTNNNNNNNNNNSTGIQTHSNGVPTITGMTPSASSMDQLVASAGAGMGGIVNARIPTQASSNQIQSYSFISDMDNQKARSRKRQRNDSELPPWASGEAVSGAFSVFGPVATLPAPGSGNNNNDNNNNNGGGNKNMSTNNRNNYTQAVQFSASALNSDSMVTGDMSPTDNSMNSNNNQNTENAMDNVGGLASNPTTNSNQNGNNNNSASNNTFPRPAIVNSSMTLRDILGSSFVPGGTNQSAEKIDPLNVTAEAALFSNLDRLSTSSNNSSHINTNGTIPGFQQEVGSSPQPMLAATQDSDLTI